MTAPTTQFFGQRWDAPQVDHALQVPTPVGVACYACSETIEDGDRGLMRACFRGDDAGGLVGEVLPVHAECDLLPVMGHQLGLCHCTGYEPTRDTARLAWRAVGRQRGRDLADRSDDPLPDKDR